MKKNILLICISVLLLSSCRQAASKLFEQTTKQLNVQYPVMVDEFTRIDSTNYTASDNTFRYFYTLVGNADNPEVAQRAQDKLESSLPRHIKEAEEMELYKKYKVNIQYAYYSESTHQELFRITITPDMYK